jgi:hypothetical protein
MAIRKRSKLAAFTLGAGLCLVGCSSALPSHMLSSFPMAGQTAEQMRTAAIECDAFAVTPGRSERIWAAWSFGGIIGVQMAKAQNERNEAALYRACMQARGYTTSATQ